MNRLLTLFLFLCLTISSFGQASNTWSVKFSNALISRYSPTINAMTGKGWEYSNTIMLHGMEKVYNEVTDINYLNYIRAYVDAYVNGSGGFSSAVTLNSLDKIHPGIVCLFLWEKTGVLKYKTIATTLRNTLVGLAPQPAGPYHRTTNGIFWHKDNGTTYDNVVMLDGMYMAHPFLAKYGSLFSDNAAIDTAVNQTLATYNQLYDPVTKLIKHAWTSTPGSYTWDGTGGNSKSVWSRAMGWYVMALVDILKYVPAGHPKRAQLITALTNLATGIKNYQDASGLWYQVVDKGTSLGGNYLETSGSAMFVYAIKTAIINGWISAATFGAVATNGWNGLKTLSIDMFNPGGDGLPRINNFCGAMSVVDGDANYVVAGPVDCPPTPAGTNHPHGYAAILMAASVMEFPLIGLPVKFISFTAKEYADRIQLAWENGTETDLDHYEIQKSINGNDFTTIGTVKATGASRYSWDDMNKENRTVYYRIKAVSINGSLDYTAILPVRQKAGGLAMQVSPNPVRDGVVNVLLNNISTGKYSLKIVSSAGTIIQTSTIDVSDNRNMIRTLQLPAGTAKGLYYVQLEGNGLRFNQNILVK
jgi:unsaturated rhamnogalacturonyl hydrolase